MRSTLRNNDVFALALHLDPARLLHLEQRRPDRTWGGLRCGRLALCGPHVSTNQNAHLPFVAALIRDCAVCRCFCNVGRVSLAYPAAGSFRRFASLWYSATSFLWSSTMCRTN